MASLSFQHVYKKYEGGVVAVSDFNLDVADKEFVILVGPSGCGKSTTLRMVAGLEEISSGELYIDGDDSEGGYGFPGLPVQKMSYDYAALAVNAMINGYIDFVIVDNGPAKAISAKMNGK